MKILGIKNYTISPVFMSGYTKPISASCKTDSFEKNEFNSEFNAFYNNLETQLGIITPEDVKSMAVHVSKKTNVPIEDVLLIMGILSQYSNYNSIKDIKSFLKQNDIYQISNLIPYYTGDNINTSPCLTNVLHYIGLKNMNFSNDTPSFKYRKKALFIDSNLINTINKMSSDEKKQIYQNILDKKNIIPIYIENFENGYNFLNQSENFEDFTTSIIKRAKIKSLRNNESIESSVISLLNNSNYKNIKKLGLNVKILKQDYKNTPEQIAENLNPIIPSRKEILDEIDNIAKIHISNKNDEINREMYKYNPNNSFENYYDYIDKIDLERNKLEIIRYMNKMTVAVSPYKYCQYLKDLNKKINEFVVKNGKSTDNIYYLIPARNRSCVLTNYEFQKVNKIKNPKNIYINDYSHDFKNLKNKISPHSTLVILDDCSISALSYTSEMFDYENISNIIPKENDINIVFAPILLTKYAEDKINYVMKTNNREKTDTVIFSKYIPTWQEIIILFYSKNQPIT